ncbi:MAG: type II toxin-antitoxin system VapC family toxin [Sphingomonadales bacterium]
MRLLLDTHCAIWAVYDRAQFGAKTRDLIESADTVPVFSAISIAEIAIKRALNRPDFPFEPNEIRDALLSADYMEMPFLGMQAVRLWSLPPIHRDPFDRMLVAQAMSEGMTLLTADAILHRYPVDTLSVS